MNPQSADAPTSGGAVSNVASNWVVAATDGASAAMNRRLWGTSSRVANASARFGASVRALGLGPTLRKFIQAARRLARSSPPPRESEAGTAALSALAVCSWIARRADIQHAVMRVTREDLAEFLRVSRYPRWYYRDRARVQWSLWHLIGIRLLEPMAGELILDIGALSGTWGGIVRSRLGARVLDVDLSYRPGVRGHRIGANAARLPVADRAVAKMASFCAFNCFEGNSDVEFLREARRVLRPGGRLVLAPFCIGDAHVNLYDPSICTSADAFDAGAARVALPRWGNNFGRWYDESTFGQRILEPLAGFTVGVVRIEHEFPEIPWPGAMFVGVFDSPLQSLESRSDTR